LEKYKKLVLLHTNDMHGDFLSEQTGEKTMGGVSMLSGYIQKTRQENENTLYCIAGDMLQGSLIDSEFRGLSTIEIMNYLQPDVVSLGNHEIDYGLGHLLLLERCAKFPIVNANLFIKSPYTRLFHGHEILHAGGMKIMFIGIITSEVLSPLKNDTVLGSLVDVEDAAREVGKISNAYKAVDIDLTVLLTHIGFEEDKRLASLLDPEWGIDIIIGGHSHTILEKPEKVNDVLIAQAGVGTDQIGRFDLVVDVDKNSVTSYKWELVPIDATHCPADPEVEKIVSKFKDQTDAKYERLMCHLARTLTHPNRYQETELGNLMCDVIKDALQLDIVMLGSGSIRKEEVGPILTRRDFFETMPYEERLYRLKVTGRQFKKMYAFMLRDEALEGEHTEFYQFSQGLAVEYDVKTRTFNRFDYKGSPMQDDAVFTLGMQGFHFTNFDSFFNYPVDDIIQNAKPVVVATSLNDVLEEHLSAMNNADSKIEGRLVILK
jgi:5''-nucleotidase/2'',3''-cyclic phosphodiesterase and related esterases